jgi:hypothetical protein
VPDLERSPVSGIPAYRYLREADHLPPTETAIRASDPPVLVKLFNPTGTGTWWITGYDPETRIATGAAHIHDFEVGDFWMGELVDFRGRFNLPLERDLGWSPKPLSEVRP